MTPFEAVETIESPQDDAWNEASYTEAFQYLIDRGIVWELQGWYGREAVNLIAAGVCVAP